MAAAQIELRSPPSESAGEAAVALDLLISARTARAVLDDAPSDVAVVARLAATLERLEGADRDAGLRLLADLERLFPGSTRSVPPDA